MKLGKELLIFDGGMGSEIQKAGLLCEYPEELSLTHPEEIRAIHRAYSCADFITTNTFGLNKIKYKGKYSIEELALAAIDNARAAGKSVFFDIGPTGALIEPYGRLTFDEAYEAFSEVVKISRDKVDGYILETFSDLYELKAAVLAVKENTDKRVFATMTFDSTGRTLTGSTPEIAVGTLEGLGVDALGVNCSLGPKEMEDIVRRIVDCAHVPVIVQPNRGLPTLKDGKTHYDLTIEDFDAAIAKFVDMGVSVVGGCCGTTPEFIKEISKYRGRQVARRENAKVCAVNSATNLVVLDGVKICGERLNPTGKKALKEALLARDFDYIVGEAIKQQQAGAQILDLNVGVPKADEPSLMREACRKVQEFVDLPLQIDSSNKDAIEAGARYYNGIPIINSVNGDDEVMDAVFPIVKKYGAMVIGLTLDSRGVPKSAEERYEIAKRIIARAEEYGIEKHRIIIDTLVLTASAEQALVKETLRALSMVASLGVKTALGVSNVSFGLPERALLNKTFLVAAMAHGLNMPIINPLDSEMCRAINAYAVLSGYDAGAQDYIARFGNSESAQAPQNDSDMTLYDAVKRGFSSKVERLTLAQLESESPMEIINNTLIRALGEVGELYGKGKIFLPQLISAAEAAKVAFAIISDKLPQGSSTRGKVVLATVKGDVHDIGKNIVKVVLQSYGFEVIDLGKDVPPEAVLEACAEHAPLAVGLSALMTTTVISMENTVKALRAAKIQTPIFVGGAVLNAEIAREIGADYYSADALELVRILESII